MLIIVLNTVILAMDSHPPIDRDLLKTFNILNQICTIIFISEAILKIIGIGFKNYFKDKMNVFDFTIIICSVLEQTIGEDGGVTALRAFRLFRLFKLAKN